jgi:hypothetical protein
MTHAANLPYRFTLLTNRDDESVDMMVKSKQLNAGFEEATPVDIIIHSSIT